MKCYLVMTILGADRPGLVHSIAEIVAAKGGNWLESRMARLAGQFAGIARIECPAAVVDELMSALQGASRPDLNLQIVREIAEEAAALPTIGIDVVGNDRPGILRELTTAIAQVGGNVEELVTGLESAPMSGHPLFHATGKVSLTGQATLDGLREAIEQLGEDLTVDLSA